MKRQQIVARVAKRIAWARQKRARRPRLVTQMVLQPSDYYDLSNDETIREVMAREMALRAGLISGPSSADLILNGQSIALDRYPEPRPENDGMVRLTGLNETAALTADMLGTAWQPLSGYELRTLPMDEIYRRQAAAMNRCTNPTPIPVLEQPSLEAIDRAWKTLYSYLSDSEKHQLDTLGYFDVPSRLTEGRVYRIPNHDATVAVRDHNKRTLSICCRPEDASIPWPDVMLAYKLGLESDEERWLETANKWTGANSVSC